jgi:hypothetical protein
MPHRKSLTFYCWLCALTALAMAAAMVGHSSTSIAAEPIGKQPQSMQQVK